MYLRTLPATFPYSMLISGDFSPQAHQSGAPLYRHIENGQLAVDGILAGALLHSDLYCPIRS